jgi:hypothetical protein
MNLETIEAITHKNNKASIALSKKHHFILQPERKCENFEYNQKVLENDLKEVSTKVNSFNFELSVLYLIQKKFDKAFDTFDKFTLSKFEQGKIKKIFAGALYRKTFEAVTSNDVKKVFEKSLSFSKLSCAESIIQTLKN